MIILQSTPTHNIDLNKDVIPALKGKQGIFVMIANYPGKFGATGHVDLLSSNGTFATGDNYYDPDGGMASVYLFILN